MSRTDKNKDNLLPDGIEKDIFRKMDVPFTKSRSEVWDSISMSINEQAVIPTKKTSLRPLIYVAASLVILLGTFVLFLRFSTNDITTLAKAVTVNLPDGSKVELKNHSKLSYHPRWWRFDRKIAMHGEAYFDVEKDGRFRVISPNGVTEVLGTTFTVVDRLEEYRVSCYSGAVSVQAGKNEVAATIKANEEVILDENGNYNVRIIPEDINAKAISEKAYFIFSSTPLVDVLNQVAAHYNIEINGIEELDFVYSGNLSRDLLLNEILTAICIPFGLNYEQTSEYTYIISHE